jgi:nucleotide-binding universal stress UspA family protein/predicted Zn-ribbon and HTH transcriptional regulator
MTAIDGYSNLYVPLDNSEHSDAAAGLAIELASAWGARCVGMHAYAARMHDFRFKQMEYTLPEEYQDEAELLRQRRIHDSLITTGLELISDSYTDVMRYRCLERGVEFEARRRDGRNWEEIVADVAEVKPDLVVMGALGTGAVRESSLGSVAERVLRRLRTDVLLVRDLDWQREGDIVVAVDGSPQSFAGLRAALELGKRFQRRVEAVAVYDPYLHYAVFNGIVDVLSEKASKVFRFKEQEALHEEIIDTGLAKIYESHLRVAEATAKEAGMELPITLLDGKAFDRLLRHCRERKPWLLVMGRIGIHSDAGMDLGSATEQLIRFAPCNLLVMSGTYLPPLDLRAEASVVWTPEAEERMARVPAGVRGLARTAVLRWATERGHSVVASGDVDEALDELMPFQKKMRVIAEARTSLEGAEQAMVEEPAAEETRAICRVCGYAARVEHPSQCPVCGAAAEEFEPFDVTALRAAADQEGDAAETGFDGHKLGWTLEARRVLQQLPAGYLRRRVKAMVEKQARTRRLPAITAEVVEPFVRPELESLDQGAGPHRAPLGLEAHTGPHVSPRRLPWSAEAEERLARISAGFLRNLASEQIERLAIALRAPEVEILHVEAGIAEARARMRERLDVDAALAAGDGCPVGATRDVTASPAAAGCPVHAGAEPADGHHHALRGGGAAPGEESENARTDYDHGLNEVSAPLVEMVGRRLTSAEAADLGSADASE